MTLLPILMLPEEQTKPLFKNDTVLPFLTCRADNLTTIGDPIV
jgi:hypothetical protein